MKTIKILGGGIAGLTTAINLKRAGIDTEVYEIKNYCGKHTKDFQFLENWTSEIDVIEYLSIINITTDFYKKPCHFLSIYSPSLKKYEAQSQKPFMYLIKRGDQEGSIDRSLEKQAIEEGVIIKFNSTINENVADVIATGCTNPLSLASGIMFDCDYKNIQAVLFDNKLSLNYYSYFIVNDKLGEIVGINPLHTVDIDFRLENLIKKVENIFNIKIPAKKDVFSAGVKLNMNLSKLKSAYKNNKYLVGNAAGFQDYLAGFGMLYAFKSGYLAAKSIIDGSNYIKLCKKDFFKTLKITSLYRKIYPGFVSKRFDNIIDIKNNQSFLIKKIIGGDDLYDVLKNLYRTPLVKILYPLNLF